MDTLCIKEKGTKILIVIDLIFIRLRIDLFQDGAFMNEVYNIQNQTNFP